MKLTSSLNPWIFNIQRCYFLIGLGSKYNFASFRRSADTCQDGLCSKPMPLDIMAVLIGIQVALRIGRRLVP